MQPLNPNKLRDIIQGQPQISANGLKILLDEATHKDPAVNEFYKHLQAHQEQTNARSLTQYALASDAKRVAEGKNPLYLN